MLILRELAPNLSRKILKLPKSDEELNWNAEPTSFAPGISKMDFGLSSDMYMA